MKMFKIILLGNAAVGKTALLHQFMYSTFKQNYKSTIGVNVFKKTIDDLNVELNLWDFGGQVIFQKFRVSYYSEADGAFIVFDVTRKETFEATKKWWDDARKYTETENLPVILLANKTDLKESQEVSEEDMNELIALENAQLIKTSAKTGENVEKAFLEISKAIIKPVRSL